MRRALGIWTFAGTAIAAPHATSEVAENYAESVAVVGVSADAKTQVNVRLARFPPKGNASLWVQVMHEGHVYSLIDESLELGGDVTATPVGAAEATFGAKGVRFTMRDRDTNHLSGDVALCVDASSTAHFVAGGDHVPICIEASFRAHDSGVRVKRGGERREVFGVQTATLTTSRGTFRLELPGKWHEQVGERPAFSAVAFTYFAVQGPVLRMLAVQSGGAAGYGYVVRNGGVAMLERFTIEAQGSTTRRFEVAFADGTAFKGTATVAQDWSHMLEGAMWHGATVTVDSELGPLSGNLNDWAPPVL